MKRERIISGILVLCMALGLIFQYVYFSRKDKMANIFVSSNIEALPELDAELLQDVCISIEKALSDNMGVKYKLENPKYYIKLVYPDMVNESDTMNGIWVRVEVSLESTGITKAEDDPYLNGYIEGMESETNPERRKALENVVENIYYYLNDEYGKKTQLYYDVYVKFDTSEFGMYRSNEITEYELLYSPDLTGDIEGLVPLEEKWPKMTYDDWKESGKRAAMGNSGF